MPNNPGENKNNKAAGAAENAHLQQVNQEIYRRNIELAIVNKTLSLLRKLYQISLLTLDPAMLSEKISETVRIDLNLELVGVLTLKPERDELSLLTLVQSKRLAAAARAGKLSFKDLVVPNVSASRYFGPVITQKKPLLNAGLPDLLSEFFPAARLKKAADESNLKTVLLYPLVTENKVIGILMLGLNRFYKSLNEHEQDSIFSLVDVVAVALDKALLYEQLKAANEGLKQLDTARSEFISIASHQLRTPPATIKWYLAALVAGDFGKLDKKPLGAVKKLEVVNNGLISLIDDLLNVSRIERGKMEFMFESLNLQALVKLAVEQLKPFALSKKLKLVYSSSAAKLPKIIADKEKLKQVVNNLIDNSIKYTKTGRITVRLDKKRDDLVLSVSDTGKGMGEAERSQIFQKFKRGRDSVHQATGLGLGLYVARVVVEHHHGKIWAESPGEGRGSTFFVSLPIHTDLTAESVLDLVQENTNKE
jgi:signal transduction histidine kinase